MHSEQEVDELVAAAQSPLTDRERELLRTYKACFDRLPDEQRWLTWNPDTPCPI